jgi:hypothetical protein
MQEFTTEQIQERFNQLPPEVQEVISSQEVLNNIQAIAKDHGLMIDQQGDLVNQVALVMLGLAKSTDFVRDLSTTLGIESGAAREIGDEINTGVFDRVKTHLREIEGAQMTTIVDNSSLEAAGGFTIEHEIPGNGEASAERESRAAEAMTTNDRINLLADIENPKPTKETTVPKGIMAQEPIRKEPLVDQLLKGGASIPEEKIVRKVVEAPKVPDSGKAAQPPKNLPTNDRYREPIQ